MSSVCEKIVDLYKDSPTFNGIIGGVETQAPGRLYLLSFKIKILPVNEYYVTNNDILIAVTVYGSK